MYIMFCVFFFLCASSALAIHPMPILSLCERIQKRLQKQPWMPRVVDGDCILYYVPKSLYLLKSRQVYLYNSDIASGILVRVACDHAITECTILKYAITNVSLISTNKQFFISKKFLEDASLKKCIDKFHILDQN